MPRHISSAEQISYRRVSALVDEAIAQTNTGDNNIYYAKKEATNLSSAGVSFPKRLTETLAASGTIIRPFPEKVNMLVDVVTKSLQFIRLKKRSPQTSEWTTPIVADYGMDASSANNIAEPNENVNTHEVNSSRPCFLLFLKTFSKVYINKKLSHGN